MSLWRRQGRWLWGAALLAALAALLPGQAAACRLALAMGLDVSASVDPGEYRLQVGGVAGALNAPAVRNALLDGPGGPVALAIYEWSGWQDQRLILDWTLLTDAEVLDGVTLRLLGTERVEMSDSTALGTALVRGGMLLERAPPCLRRVLDISGDGKNNDGADPDMLEGEPSLIGVTVNALVIGTGVVGETGRTDVSAEDLSEYFEDYVIRGPGAFVQIARGFEDYERAMTLKLLREVEPAAMSLLLP